MNYNFWEVSTGTAPVENDIENLADKDADSAAKLIKKLESLENYSFEQLRHAKTVEHIRGKVWTLRYDLKNKMCRIYFKTDKQGILQLLHLTIKKEWKLKSKDIDIAERRAKMII